MFVMQHYQLSWEDALHLVQNRRYCISPNGGFLTQIKVHLTTSSPCHKQFISWSLQEYEAIYKASLAVQSFPAAKKIISRRKREEGQDDDMQIRYVHIWLFEMWLNDYSAETKTGNELLYRVMWRTLIPTQWKHYERLSLFRFICGSNIAAVAHFS